MEKDCGNDSGEMENDGTVKSVNPQTDDIIVNGGNANNPYNTFEQNHIRSRQNSRSEEGNKENLENESTYSVTKPNSGFIHAWINFTKSFIGIGPLTIAAAMRNAGVILGPLCIAIWGLLWLYGVNIMVETRRRLLKERLEENRQFAYLPGNAQRNYRELRPEEIEEDENEQHHEINDLDSRDSCDKRIHGKHRIKTYSDLGREAYGDWGYYAVNFVIFFQQMTIITAYFYFLNKYFPSYLVLIVITPICMFWGLRKISYVSLMSLTFVTFVLFSVVAYSIKDISIHSKTNMRFFDVLNFPLFFRCMSFSIWRKYCMTANWKFHEISKAI